MDDWDFLAHAAVPDGKGTLTLASHDGEYCICIDGRSLMGTEHHASEDALADLACDRLDQLDTAEVLVGGLGMGFTLAAVLRRLGPEAKATVAELIPEVVTWNQEHVGQASGHPLRDERVAVSPGDVRLLLGASTTTWDAILLDVDNGPQGFTVESNTSLYSDEGIQHAWNALKPRGILAIWSAGPDDPSFTRRLQHAGFETELVTHANGPAQDVLWMARRPASPA